MNGASWLLLGSAGVAGGVGSSLRLLGTSPALYGPSAAVYDLAAHARSE